MKLHLSKTTYCNAIQCPKMLWLKINRSEEFDASVLNQGVLETGSEVGDLAMGLFGDFREVPFRPDDPQNLANMLSITQEYLRVGVPVIAEASFTYEGCFCSVDVLRVLPGNAVEVYEVKSTTDLHEIHLHDVAYQCHILQGLGYSIKKAGLVHINRNYVRHGALDLHGFFTIEDITGIVLSMQENVRERIGTLQSNMQQQSEPMQPTIGEHCTSPYECGFWAHCTKNLPHPNIFDVSNVAKKIKWENYRNGVVSFADIEAASVLSESNRLQVSHTLHSLPPQIHAKQIAGCLKTLSYPLYFLDFESCNPAIPPYDGMKPFEQMVFQYSLHYIEAEGASLKHKEFLAYPGSDPRRDVAEHLCRDIPENVCVTAYNMTFERSRIRELAMLYPDLAEHLMNIHDHIQDLIIPFQKKWYYDRAMEGSYSIKYVLPALFPNDPSLDYHNLEGVHNGEEASNTFKRMGSMSDDELSAYRLHLLKYCGLDTYAMVKVWEKLREVSGTPLPIQY